ncbi:MAG TPA: hypothetical protein VMV62_00420 [Candidatus Paceibacterota bacterium]|nr:hypothetical protein [Candidatus Paceibacterota bacterium]
MATLLLGACSSMSGPTTIGGQPAGPTPPEFTGTASGVPVGLSTYAYQVTVYPGLDGKFDPDPKLTYQEYTEIRQLDWYCARRTDQISGRAKEMWKQAGMYGGFEGVLGTIGALWGFPGASAGSYLKYIGATGAGGGLASGSMTFEATLNVAHGYCMTQMVYKSDELEHKLQRISIIPLYTGQAKLPLVTDGPAPAYVWSQKTSTFLPPPPQ